MDNQDDENILVENANRGSESQGRKTGRYLLEPALLVVFFGYNLASTILPSQLLKQTCLHDGYNQSDCDNIGGNKTKYIEDKIQPHVAEIIMTNNLLNSIIPAIMSLFLGPWTDKFGRKKVICATCGGFSLTLVSFAIVSYIADQTIVNPWIYTLPYIPIIATGGWPSMIVAILCYTSDLSKEANRSTRLAIIEMIIFLGVLLGTFSCSYVLALTSPTILFVISATIVSFATAFIVVFVEESVEVIENVGTCVKIKELVSHAPVVDMLKTCFKRRPFGERRILWCLVVILMFTIFTLNGTSNIFYLFAQEKFQWTLRQTTTFDSISLVISLVGAFIGIVFLKKLLKISDLSLAIISIVSMIVDSLIKAFAESPTTMYVASSVSLFKILSSPMCRSLISSIIPNNETGKVYSIASSFEAVSSLVASPLYTFIYAKTLTFFAGAFYLITAGVYVINLILAVAILKMMHTRESLMNPYSQIDNS
jgi:MFS transporter, PCFT/HCP family, solute carrier family 46 (folate transporter), member 1